MKKFSDFDIEVEQSTFVGDKIPMARILNRKIIVHAYKIEPSKYYENERLTLQLEFRGTKHICFSSSNQLLRQIRQVPPDGFPFETTIEEENQTHLFT